MMDKKKVGVLMLFGLGAFLWSRRSQASIAPSYNYVPSVDQTPLPDFSSTFDWFAPITTDLTPQPAEPMPTAFDTQTPVTEYATADTASAADYTSVAYDQQESVTNAISNALTSIGSPIMTMVTGKTRGERNNNPGNIEKGQQWQGLAAQQPDPRFCTFTDASYGIRAMGKILQSYSGRGLNTIRKIISQWSPQGDPTNAAGVTANYIASVSNQTGIAPDTVLNMQDASTLTAIINAMITVENGRNIYVGTQLVSTGVSMALA